MDFYVEQRVLDLGLKIKFVVINGVNNKRSSDYLSSHLNDLILEYKDFDLESDKILEGFHKIHEKGNISRRKNIPASENLIRLLKENNHIYHINSLVDIYNTISIESKLCLGCHDIDKTSGNVTLRFHNGSEAYNPIGDNSSHKVKLNEYSYIDDANDILCRLEVRQVLKTKVTEDSTNVFYIVEGNEQTSDDYLNDVCNKIISITTTTLGGTGYIKEANVIWNLKHYVFIQP